jgi:hypothetical protein
MPPEPSAEDWARVEADYERREAQRAAERTERVMAAHRWPGGYFCQCGRALNSPDGWGRHLLAEFVADDAEG